MDHTWRYHRLKEHNYPDSSWCWCSLSWGGACQQTKAWGPNSLPVFVNLVWSTAVLICLPWLLLHYRGSHLVVAETVQLPKPVPVCYCGRSLQTPALDHLPASSPLFLFISLLYYHLPWWSIQKISICSSLGWILSGLEDKIGSL